MLQLTIDTKRHSLVQIFVVFKETKIILSKSIYFHFKTLTKQILVFF